MNRSPRRADPRREILQCLGNGDQSYDELLERYQRALPAHDVDTREAFAVLIGAMVGEGLLERDLAASEDTDARVIHRLRLSDRGRAALRASAASNP